MADKKKNWLKPLDRATVEGIQEGSESVIEDMRKEGEDPWHYEVNHHLATALLKAWDEKATAPPELRRTFEQLADRIDTLLYTPPEALTERIQKLLAGVKNVIKNL